jgi:dTDP-4-amino-4,6-dideoxygalactose transaminase
MYYLLLPSLEHRTAFIERLRSDQINTVFHYTPLHSSPYGQRLGRVAGNMANTDSVSERLVRLPMWLGLEEEQPHIIRKMLSLIDALD